MHVNPYNEKLLTITYFVTTTDETPVNAIVNCATTIFKSDELNQSLI